VILVEQQPPQGFFVCDHAGLVINEFSLTMLSAGSGGDQIGIRRSEADAPARAGMALQRGPIKKPARALQKLVRLYHPTLYQPTFCVLCYIKGGICYLSLYPALP